MGSVAKNGSPLLEVQGISKEFSGVRVLDRISFSLSKGEIFGIIGENGAGKSTLIKIISGIYHPTEGSLIFDGKRVTVRDAEVAQKMGINLIPQEFNLIPEMTVSENIFLGKELRKRLFLNQRAMVEKTAVLLNYLRSDISPVARIGLLSVAQKQMVEFAKALASESKLLILDEPTTVLTRKEIDILFEIMRKSKQTGVTMIYISHKLKEVKEICDRVMVLRDGQLISIESSDQFSVHDMATKMVGRELSQVFPPKAKPQEEVLLRVSNLSVTSCLEDISFDLKKGEILGFAGLVGAGRTELAETLIGLRRKSAGTIFLSGKELHVKDPASAFANGLAYLSEDRQGSGILTAFGIAENITLTSLKRYSKVLLHKKKELAKAQEYVRKFDIKAASLKTRLEFFSGGNQQKVSFAKSLDADPQIIVIDEPTRGIDVQAKHELYRFIHLLVESGLSCMLISSEMEEIIGMSNRVVVMKEGRITGVLTGDQINEEEIMFYATGLKGVA